MKRESKSVLLIGWLLFLAVIIGYLLIAWYYRDRFCLNTWINGIYCTGKTVDEVNSEFLAGQETPILTITDNSGNQYTIDMSDAGYSVDFYRELCLHMEKQQPLLWIKNIWSGRKYHVEPLVTYDKEQLRALFDQLPFVEAEARRDADYYILHTPNKGYVLYDGLSQRLDGDKAFEQLTDRVLLGEYTLDLQEADCYYDSILSKEQEADRELWEKITRFQQCALVYDMGDEKIPLDAAVMSNFIQKENGEIALDNEGNLMVDEGAVKAFVDSMGDTYDTYKKERKFLSTSGKWVTVSGVTYGTVLDRETEVTFLMENLLTPEFHTGEQHLRIPEYERQGFHRGKNDMGSTYIEINMTEQKMYYYEDGELLVETEVVTGNTRSRMGTPEGINYVYKKQTNRILRGPGYASFVKYWMPVKGAIGIHDADWRDEFGGTIYQGNGSHGCINTPTDKMTQLYEMVEIGTPVVMFYED